MRGAAPLTHTVPQPYIPMPTPTPVVQPQPMQGHYHTVLPKQTLWRISRLYGVPMNVIMKINRIRNPAKISVGQQLYIPGVIEEYRPDIPLYRDTGHWTHIVIHHTATFEGDADTINQIHLNRGWRNGLGYHFLIDNGTEGHEDGEIEIGHRWNRQMNGAHAKKANMNKVGIGVALVGNFSQSQVSERQQKALVYLVKILQQHYGIPNSRVLSHRGVLGAATECPGTHFPWEKFKRMLRE